MAEITETVETDSTAPAPVEVLDHVPGEAAVWSAAEALARRTIPSERRLFGFYDRLRARMLKTLERRGGKLSESGAKALLLVPDVFVLLVRLALDKEVPGSIRALIGGALAYFILPLDLLPEAILGGAGYLDDLVLAVAVLSQAFGGEIEPFARKHWSGPEDLRVVLRDVTATAEGLLGTNLYQRVRRLLSRRGVHLGNDPRR
jgi:uncharacterized membrane protein YkvA (DUF1232 family)